MHSITLNQNWKFVRVTLDPPQEGPFRKGNEPIGLSSTRGPIFSNKAVGTAYFVFIKFLNKTTKIENMQLSNLARLKQSGTHRLTF